MRKLILISLGFLFLTLGAVGAAIPVLPTTPFVLFAAGCFSLSSKRLDDWLKRSRLFGPYIENYRTGGGVSLLRKVAAIAFLWTGLIVSMVVVQAVWAYFVLGAVGAGVTLHLLLVKTRKKDGR